MSNFVQDFRGKYPELENEALVFERLIQGIDKILLQDKSIEIVEIKTMLFDFVVLTNLLKRLKVKYELTGDTKQIRDSMAHLDERMENFDSSPTEITGEAWEKQSSKGGKFKISTSVNFQGAITSARISTSGRILAVGPYGMIDDNFLWIDKNGKQRHTQLEQVREEYSKFIGTLSLDEK